MERVNGKKIISGGSGVKFLRILSKGGAYEHREKGHPERGKSEGDGEKKKQSR
jgi:hypothetical protein